MFSVNTEEQAKMLIVMTCPRDDAGTYYARELAGEQNLENLRKFSDKLQAAWDHWGATRAARGEPPL